MARSGEQRWFRSGDEAVRPAARAGGLHVRALLVIALIILFVSRTNPAALEPLREAVLELVRPVLVVTAGPLQDAAALARGILRGADGAVGHATRAGTGDRPLDARIDARLQELQRENLALRQLVPFTGSKQHRVLAADVIGGSAGAAASALLIAAGREDGIKPGYPVIMGEQLVGRVHRVHRTTAVVSSLSGRLSRVPVHVGAGQTRAIMVGNGDGSASLELVGRGTAPATGDVVTTSGIGGVFPRGLVIGRIVSEAPPWRLIPVAETAYEPVVGVLVVEGAVFEPADTLSCGLAPASQGQRPSGERERP